jgi:hypothetical protein
LAVRFLAAGKRLTKAAFLTQTVVVDDMTVKFEIWDTVRSLLHRDFAHPM